MNWRLIIFSAAGAAVGINLLIVLTVWFMLYSGLLQYERFAGLEKYLIPFALFSPLIASIVSCAVVTHFSRSKKLLHTILSTLITFTLSTAILAYFTTNFSLMLYDRFDRPTNQIIEKPAY
jgi:hypothetical protein